jgi:hypothetical protein
MGGVSDTMLFVEPMVLCQPCLVFYYAESGTPLIRSSQKHDDGSFQLLRKATRWLTFVFINNRISSSSEISDDATLRGSSSSS